MKTLESTYLLIALVLLLATPAGAVIQLTYGVFGGGGTTSTGGGLVLRGTLGQNCIGSAAESLIHEAGFWHLFVDLLTAVDENAGMPMIYELSQNYPNPFNPLTNIRYSVPKAGRVLMKLYDVRGRAVAKLVDGEHEPGFYSLTLNASKLGSGVYFYRMKAGDYQSVHKLVILK
jgi:hypothetical protein